MESSRRSLWPPVLSFLAALGVAAAVWFALPTTTTYYPSSAAFMPTKVTEAVAAASSESLSVSVDLQSSTLTVTRSGAEPDLIVVPESLLPDAVLLLASAGAEVEWPPEATALGLAREGVAPVQVDSPLLSFLRWILLSGCVVWASMSLVVFVRRRAAGGRFRRVSAHAARIPQTRFDDVAGADEAVEDLREVVQYLSDPGPLERLGAKPPRGVLLVGPPGTGKTLLARAVAGEAGASFFAASGADFMERFVGVGSSRVRALFEDARRNAPSIVFIDEIDAVGRSRTDSDTGSSSESDHTLVSLLNEIDGFRPRDRVVVIGATNRPDILDSALVRAGRLERRVEVPLPDRRGRRAVLDLSAKGVRLAEGVDLGLYAARTPGFSGAQLSRLLNEAALRAARRSAGCVSGSDLDSALADIAMGRARYSALVSDRDRLLTSWHEAGHAVAALVLRDAPDPAAVSIVPRGPAGGATWMVEPDDAFFTRSAAHARMVVAMAGRAAEKLVLDGDFTQGASHDLEAATHVAEALVTKFGMAEGFFARRHLGNGAWPSDVTLAVDRLVERAMNAADDLVLRHEGLTRALAERLIECEELSKDDLLYLHAEHASELEVVDLDAAPPAPHSAPGRAGSPLSLAYRARAGLSRWQRRDADA